MNFIQHGFTKLKKTWQWIGTRPLWAKGVLVIVLLSAGWFGYTRLNAPKKAQIQQVTTQAEVGTLISTISASGSISSGGAANITTSATGVVSKVYVKSGDSVMQGQKIAEVTLDQSSKQKQQSAYASYLSAQNSLKSAQASLNSLQAALFEANQTFIKGAGNTNDPIVDDPTYIIQKARWLQAEANYTNQQGSIAQAQANLASASLSYQQSSSTITAPTAGTIQNLLITEGLPVSSSSTSTDTTSVQTIGNVTPQNGQTRAVVNLSEIDVTKVSVGQKVTITMDAFADKSFTGKVTLIDTSGSSNSGVTTYPATITFDTALDTMYPNMGVNAEIITSVKNDVVLVPSGAVTTVNGQSTIAVMKDGKTQQVQVEIGESNGTQTEIVSGIAEGDTIVTTTTSAAAAAQTKTGNTPFGATGFGGGFSTGAVRVIGR